jgi:hypothetical protein
MRYLRKKKALEILPMVQTDSKNYENKVCDWCVNKKQELEDFVISEVGIDRAIKMLQEIKQSHGI